LRAPTAGVSKLLRPSTNIGDIYLETSAHLFEIQLRRSTHGGFGYRFDDETRRLAPLGGAPVGPDLAGLWGRPAFLVDVTND